MLEALENYDASASTTLLMTDSAFADCHDGCLVVAFMEEPSDGEWELIHQRFPLATDHCEIDYAILPDGHHVVMMKEIP